MNELSNKKNLPCPHFVVSIKQTNKVKKGTPTPNIITPLILKIKKNKNHLHENAFYETHDFGR